MAKKVSMLLAATALFAFAVPTFASANAKITDPPGTPLSAVGEPKLLATNIGDVTIQTSLGLIVCSTFDFTWKLTANTGTTYKGVGLGTGTTSSCFIDFNKPVTLTDVTIKEIHSATTLKGLVKFRIVVDLPGGIVCSFEGVNIPYTVTGSDTFKLTSGDSEASPAACEPGLINGTFTLETDFRPFTAVTID